MKQKSTKEPNFDLLLNTIQGFYETGRVAARSLNTLQGRDAMQKLAPAVVNMTFSAELAIKCLNLIANKSSLRGHGLSDLFYKLPKDLREQIEQRYNDRLVQENEAQDYMHFRIIFFTLVDALEEPKAPRIDNLRDFLKIHDRAFEEWRYLYETGQPGDVMQVNFPNLNSLMSALIDTLNLIPKTVIPIKPKLKNQNP